MAPGAQRSPANRQAKRYSSAPHHSVAKAVRISQSHHGSCTEWGDRIFPARFTSLDRHRAVPHLLRRSESSADGTAGAKSRSEERRVGKEGRSRAEEGQLKRL